MELSKLTKEPKLVKLVIDDEDVIKEHGEAIEFYTWDRHPMDVFLKLASVDAKDSSTLIAAVKDLVLDSKGEKILTGNTTLPTNIMTRVITRIVNELGK